MKDSSSTTEAWYSLGLFEDGFTAWRSCQSNIVHLTLNNWFSQGNYDQPFHRIASAQTMGFLWKNDMHLSPAISYLNSFQMILVITIILIQTTTTFLSGSLRISSRDAPSYCFQDQTASSGYHFHCVRAPRMIVTLKSTEHFRSLWSHASEVVLKEYKGVAAVEYKNAFWYSMEIRNTNMKQENWKARDLVLREDNSCSGTMSS